MRTARVRFSRGAANKLMVLTWSVSDGQNITVNGVSQIQSTSAMSFKLFTCDDEPSGDEERSGKDTPRYLKDRRTSLLIRKNIVSVTTFCKSKRGSQVSIGDAPSRIEFCQSPIDLADIQHMSPSTDLHPSPCTHPHRMHLPIKGHY